MNGRENNFPGTETGYHAVTYGWLVDQIVRHVDEKHRSVGTFFREEIAEPNGIDFHIGLPTSEEWRVARLSTNTFLDSLSEVCYSYVNISQVATDYRAIKYFLLMKKFFSVSNFATLTEQSPGHPHEASLYQHSLDHFLQQRRPPSN